MVDIYELLRVVDRTWDITPPPSATDIVRELPKDTIFTLKTSIPFRKDLGDVVTSVLGGARWDIKWFDGFPPRDIKIIFPIEEATE